MHLRDLHVREGILYYSITDPLTSSLSTEFYDWIDKMEAPSMIPEPRSFMINSRFRADMVYYRSIVLDTMSTMSST
jgi:hypothetical protein